MLESEFRKLKILITGGSGFIGSGIAKHLVNVGESITLLLRDSSALCRYNPKVLEKIKIIRFDSSADVKKAVQNILPNVVIHTACSYGKHGNTSGSMYEANVLLGMSILEALPAMENECIFLNAGTSLPEDLNEYSRSKWEFVKRANEFCCNNKNVKFLNARFQTVYGDMQGAHGFVDYVIKTCLENAHELLLTPGEQLRDFIYINDVISACRSIINNEHNFPNNTNIDVGTGKAIRIKEIVMKIKEMTKSTTCLKFGALQYRYNEPMSMKAHLSCMQTIGWSPQFDVTTGLLKIIERTVD